ncbi:lipoprotein cytochrome c, 7 heme-binding sites [Geotalea daltonii FRC-32]|uniref:Lipoprotein cytochrome c, 7 heme-binding sites n=1 Tax=Geotalea daltonii (strain DSM 22248 / JCM 15807 / FRC-32) TaxID=316067 RepID=B9M464_GEODF|nr:cytochrome c [Geotalea daltonii]ACM21519.1 lipoprotein cytochrome c, 7 heme-binding sites [Geotalea daltonii FRC-32]
MHHLLMRLILIGTAAATMMLSGCGGSNQSSAPPTVSGIAATGLPIVGQVYLKDSAATPRELSAPTGKDGSYVINVSGLTAPFIVKAQWNGSQSLVSFASAPGTANINPLSHLIVASAAGVTDPETLYNSSQESKIRISSGLQSSISQVISQLKPLMDAYGVTVDPISGPFVANHTGLDAMLDGVKMEASGGTVTVSNRATGGTIFTAPIGGMMSGTFTAANLPAVSPGQAQPSIDGASLYAANCASCHGALTSSSKPGASVARIQSAINAQVGGMGSLSTLTPEQVQAIAMALATAPSSPPSGTPNPTPAPNPAPGTAPPATVDGPALYAGNCAGCHGALATSTKKGMTLTRLDSSINSGIGGMGSLSSLTVTEKQAIVDALATAASTPTPAPAPTTPEPTPVPTPATPIDGAALYAGNCAGCHGVLASSGKKGTTLTRLQSAISNNIAGMGTLSPLSTAQLQAIVDVLAAVAPTPTPTPTPAPGPTPAPAPAPAPVDGATLYAGNCAACHGALASSGKAGATAVRIQAGINNNAGGMGTLSSLSSSQVQGIADALATITPAPTPAPAPVCGSCHALPPANGKHSKHRSRSCSTCHGTGYSATTVNSAIHSNGVKNVVSTIGWNPSARTCANSCHGRESW